MTTHSNFTENGKLVAEAIVKALEAQGISARIGQAYLDYGQGWTWDTVLVIAKENSEYQALNPRQFKQMNEGTFNYSEINTIVAFKKATFFPTSIINGSFTASAPIFVSTHSI